MWKSASPSAARKSHRTPRSPDPHGCEARESRRRGPGSNRQRQRRLDTRDMAEDIKVIQRAGQR
jgi:hypothetical protein